MSKQLADALRAFMAKHGDVNCVDDEHCDARAALAAYDARTFHDEAADMAERAGEMLRNTSSITQAEKLVALMRAAYDASYHAFQNPAYREPQA